jgi:hypothetical protein
MPEALSPGERFKALRDEFRSLEQREAAIAKQNAEVQKRKAEVKNLIADLMLSLPASPTPQAATPPSPAPSGPKPKATDDSGRGEKLLALLRQNRGAPPKWLAQKLYGDPKATGRVSSLLDYLRKTGKARTYARGKWEAVS